MSKQLVYVSHPYNGKETNKESVENYIRELIQKDNKRVYFSPIHNYSMLYDEMKYIEGLKLCLDALECCSTIVLCGDWEQSKGCLAEWAYAKARGKQIYTYSEWSAKIQPKDNSKQQKEAEQ